MLTAFFLGAFHGLNPAMGWLFAVALGMQERKRAEVLRAFLPIAAGHFLAVAAALVLFFLLRIVLGGDNVRYAAAFGLIAFGVYHLFRARHSSRGGMRMGAAGLALWSFLAAFAHGAGFMLAPFLPAAFAPANAHSEHFAQAINAAEGWAPALFAHTLGFFIVMVAIAIIVYEKLGVALLRKAWININAIWAISLITAGILSPFL